MGIELAIGEFTQKVISPLIADLTRNLEVTYGKTGEQNHGSKFIGNSVVLTGIETIGQFINPKSQAELESFVRDGKAAYKPLAAEQKRFVQARYAPDDALGSVLAKQFIKRFFHKRFSRKNPALGGPLIDVVWAFRNPHSHAFYPYVKRQFGSKEMNGGIMWLYKNKKKTGISIKQIEANLSKFSRKLYRIKGNYIFVCPQILLVYFKHAIERFKGQIKRDRSVREVFLLNYRRLMPVYQFVSLDDSAEGDASNSEERA